MPLVFVGRTSVAQDRHCAAPLRANKRATHEPPAHTGLLRTGLALPPATAIARDPSNACSTATVRACWRRLWRGLGNALATRGCRVIAAVGHDVVEDNQRSSFLACSSLMVASFRE
jgi:hypothetical protein